MGDADSIRQVRLLLNDVDPARRIFEDQDIEDFLTLESGHVKLAAAQAIDTNATNEVLASKVLRSQDWQTDGAKIADAMRGHADRLRQQHADSLDEADDGFFQIVDAEGW